MLLKCLKHFFCSSTLRSYNSSYLTLIRSCIQKLWMLPRVILLTSICVSLLRYVNSWKVINSNSRCVGYKMGEISFSNTGRQSLENHCTGVWIRKCWGQILASWPWATSITSSSCRFFTPNIRIILPPYIAVWVR